jgi:hypothetical protein
MNPPTIRIEIEGMKQTLMTMLGQRAALLSEEMQAAVDNFCTPERIQQIITETAHRQLMGIVEDEVRSFFAYGAGRRTIQQAMQKKLDEMFPEGGHSTRQQALIDLAGAVDTFLNAKVPEDGSYSQIIEPLIAAHMKVKS